MPLRISVSGIKFRAGDTGISTNDKIRIVNARLTNTSIVKFREGDLHKELPAILYMRKSPGIETTNIDLSAIDVVQIGLVPEMLEIQAGKFKMGGTNFDDELPVREIEISAFALAKYPVTNEQYEAYLAKNGIAVYKEDIVFLGKDKHPAVMVTWHDAINYCKWLSDITARKFRLPTEAEWEYAARGGEDRGYPWGDKDTCSNSHFSMKETHPVDKYPGGASPFGVMDMCGNVSEWILDWHAKYDPENLINPQGPGMGTEKVLRGASLYTDERSTFFQLNSRRQTSDPDKAYIYVGFRIAEDLQ